MNSCFRLMALLPALLAGACADLEFLRPADALQFELTGRIAVRYRDEASSGGISWRHRTDGDEVLLATPLGQGVARIVREAGTVTLTTADGKQQSAADAEALTESMLGFRLPLAGLADWVRGRESVGPAEAQRDTDGRLSRLEQGGWVVEYLEYGENRLPSRMKLGYPGIEIRLAVSEWKLEGAP
ncbi:MAG: outer membrane lipoprotein LolB [Betaproteobacteria bacterium]|nr:outer membrane lipoprotein LolB [Betaproteobacteria bacterium]